MRIIFIALLGGVLLAQKAPLPNGVYGVEDGKAANGKTLVARQYESRQVVLDTATYAPLTLAGKPEVNRDPRGSWLSVQLSPEAAKRLEDLTRSHLDRPIAVVVGDKVLSTPTVRDVIKDGKARVTPCEDESCETLLRQLSK